VIHPTAEVDAGAVIGDNTSIWNWSKVREGAHIGRDCRVGQNVYIDHDVEVGDGCKIQNGVSVFHGVTIGQHVFIGPSVTFTNDLVPRADSGDDWTVVPTRVDDHASIGANATIVCGTTLGRGCMVGAAAVVTRDVPPFGLVMGNPARLVDYVDLAGNRLHRRPGDPPSDLVGVAG
jgi:acetyltransferase-like isoleucine patch superfamily enzyme